MISSLPGVIGLHWYSSCSMYCLTVSREPAQEYGASACLSCPGCPISGVLVKIKEHLPINTLVALFKDPAGE